MLRTTKSRRIGAVFASVALATGVLAGCSSTTTASPTGNSADPAAQAASVQVVDAAAFQQAIADGAKVIDVRTPAEFATGHIEGAVNLDIAGPDFAAEIAALDPQQDYAVYCRSGNRSAVASAQMADIGITSIVDLGTGIGGWQAANYPVV